MMLSTFTPFPRVGCSRFSPRQANNGYNRAHCREPPTGLTGVSAMCKAERDIMTVKELADGSLMFSFGTSLPSGSTRKSTDLSSSHAEHIASSEISLPRRMPSNFKRQSPIPLSAARKSEMRIWNQRQEITGAKKSQGNFGSEKVIGEADNLNNSKKGYQIPQRSPTVFAKRSYVSSPDDGPSFGPNESSSSSGEDDIVALFKRIQSQPTVSKENAGNDQKSNTYSSPSKSKKSAESVLRVLRQYPEKNKNEIKENASQKRSSEVVNEKITAKRSSRRGPRNIKSRKTTNNLGKSLSETFVLLRPRSNFVRRSPIPLSTIRRRVRPVPSVQLPEITSAQTTSVNENKDISRDSDGTSTAGENSPLISDLKFCLSEGQLNALSHLKLTELKKTAKSYGLKGYSKLKKAELLELLRNALKQS